LSKAWKTPREFFQALEKPRLNFSNPWKPRTEKTETEKRRSRRAGLYFSAHHFSAIRWLPFFCLLFFCPPVPRVQPALRRGYKRRWIRLYGKKQRSEVRSQRSVVGGQLHGARFGGIPAVRAFAAQHSNTPSLQYSNSSLRSSASQLARGANRAIFPPPSTISH
jgi:hypothetical protein